MMKQHGFTLVELMITLSIAAILTTVAIPSFTETIKNNRLATKINLMAGSLNLARSEAVKRGLRVNICVSNATQTACAGGNNFRLGWITYVDADSSNGFTPGDQIIHTVESLPPSMTFTGTAPEVGFTPQGAARVVGTFTLCDDRTGEIGREITLNVTGRAHLDNPVPACA